jgi:hypothetical protein
MNFQFKKAFLKDLSKIKDRRLIDAVHQSISNTEQAKIHHEFEISRNFPALIPTTEFESAIIASV